MSLLSLGFSLVVMTSSPQWAVPKQIGAPASDLYNNRLRSPDPSMTGRTVGHAMIDITFDDNGLWSWELGVPPSSHLSLLPVGPDCDTWQLAAIDPAGHHDGDNRFWTEGDLEPFFPTLAHRLDIANPLPGRWTITLQGGQPGETGMLIVRDRSGVGLQCHPTSHVALIGRPITLRAALVPIDQSGYPLQDALSAFADGLDIIDARMTWQDDRKTPESIELIQNGPWLESSFTPVVSGPVTARLEIEGVDADGFSFVRTTHWHGSVQHEIAVTNIEIHEIDEERIAIDLELTGDVMPDRVLLGAEAWCKGPDGHQPRCWIGGISVLEGAMARLVLDKRWLTLEGGSGEALELREIRIANPNGARPLLPTNAIRSIPVGTVTVPDTVPDPTIVLSELLHGKGDQKAFINRRRHQDSGTRQDQYGGHNLMLSHGYCSDGDSFPPSDFTGNVAEYVNIEQNFSHDEFALDILSFGQQYKSYGIVGHSQGGNAALHLYTFYWSGLDWAGPGRLLQAMGTPFTGTPLAGDISVLGEIFGIGCGVNDDLTYQGASNWLSFIPTSTRSRTWTWSSTFEDNWWSYDYCNILSDLLLWDPEDGVVENSEADLDGGNNMGTTIGWCHIQYMTEPAEYWDTNRTSEMDAEGAR